MKFPTHLRLLKFSENPFEVQTYSVLFIVSLSSQAETTDLFAATNKKDKGKYLLSRVKLAVTVREFSFIAFSLND